MLDGRTRAQAEADMRARALADREAEMVRIAACPLRPAGAPIGRGLCDWCGKALAGRQRRWCSEPCFETYWQNHGWTAAAEAAVRRDDHKCVWCGSPDREVCRGVAHGWEEAEPTEVCRAQWLIVGEQRLRNLRVQHDRYARKEPLEVDHIEPRWGQGYGDGCHNHLVNLRTLCHRCHVNRTTVQLRLRKMWATIARPLLMPGPLPERVETMPLWAE
jgi:hypothetical protein